MPSEGSVYLCGTCGAEVEIIKKPVEDPKCPTLLCCGILAAHTVVSPDGPTLANTGCSARRKLRPLHPQEADLRTLNVGC